MPIPILIGVNALRVFGYFFIIHYAAGRLPAPFAPSAGWGDVLAGVTAIPVAFIAAWQATGWRPIAFLWNLVGIVDLVLAICLRRDVGDRFTVPVLHRGTGHRNDGGAADVSHSGVPGASSFVLTHIAVFAATGAAGDAARDAD